MSSTDKDYKETLFLPNTNFPMRANLPEREKEWLARWEKLNIYKKLRENSGERKAFVLHDGPPYANGNLHIGHALNKILKDFVVRSQQVLGNNSIYVPGWDCHGLPIEWKIEEKYREKGKSKEDVPINKLREDCRDFASHWIDIQKEEFKRLGVTGDWSNPYSTMDYTSEAVISEEFVKLVMKGVVYRGSKPVMWSPVEKTALAEAEIEYRDHRSTTIWVRFSVASGELKGSDVLIWTTTPWTIPSNKAVAFNKAIKYGVYQIEQVQDESWAKPQNTIILADKLAKETMEKSRVTKYKKIRDLSLEDLDDITLSHPFAKLEGAESFWDYAVPLVEGDHVTDDVGTGFVHIAPSHGAEDFEVFLKRGWLSRMTNNVEDNALMLEVIAGSDGLDPRQIDIKTHKYTKSLLGKNGIENLRIGVVKEGFQQEGYEDDVNLKVRSALNHFREAGAVVEEVSIPLHLKAPALLAPIYFEGGTQTMMYGDGYGVSRSDLYSTSLMDFHRNWRTRANELPATVKLVTLLGTYIRKNHGSRYFGKSINLIRMLRSAYDEKLSSYNLLVMPTTAAKAQAIPNARASITEVIQSALPLYLNGNTQPFNATHHPAMAVPCGMSEGLPVSLMLIGKHFDEPTIYRAAHAFQETIDWRSI